MKIFSPDEEETDKLKRFWLWLLTINLDKKHYGVLKVFNYLLNNYDFLWK